ncbi:MAG: ATP-binding cassette domain-containing protein [Crocinitomicaceae bacterium]
MLEAKSISVEKDHLILEDVSLLLSPGKIIGVIGKSGEGKTTLLKSLAGRVSLASGEIIFDGIPLLDPSEKLIPEYEDIQLVDQDFGLALYQTVEENIREKILSLDKKTRDEFVDELIELVELEDARNRKAHLLSGGEQQRLSIARAIAKEPKVFLLDEPFAHLDQRLRLKIVNYFQELVSSRDVGILIVSHDGSELLGMVDDIAYLKNGRIARVDKAFSFYFNPTDKAEGQLLGPLNQVQLDGKSVFFRPTEFVVSDLGIDLKYRNTIHTGLFYFNYFESENGEEVMLASSKPMSNDCTINIERNVH